MNNNQLIFGNKLRELRKSNGLTQEGLGEKIGVSTNAVGQFERGSILPTFSTLTNIINALDVDANLFFDRRSVDYPDEAKRIARIFESLTNEEKQTVGRFLEDLSKVFLNSQNLNEGCNEDSNL